MAVLLSMFDTRMGPVVWLAMPERFNEAIVKRTAKLMDFFHEQDEFFIQDNADEGIKSINMAFSVDSAWARGKKELVQVSVFTTEESPPIEAYKEKLQAFKARVLEDPDAYMAFYTGPRQDYIPQIDGRERYKTMASKQHDRIEGLLRWLDESVRIDIPATYAFTIPVAGLSLPGGGQGVPALPLPASAHNEMKDLAHTRGVSDVFVVYRKVGDMMKADIIPAGPMVIKVRIIVRELTPELIMQTSKIISLPLLFTSGICQEKAGKCSYEAFFSIAPPGAGETMDRIREGLGALEVVEHVDISIVPRS